MGAVEGSTDVVPEVGHGITQSEIIKGLGTSATVVVGEENDDNFFVVAMQPNAAPTVVNLKY